MDGLHFLLVGVITGFILVFALGGGSRSPDVHLYPAVETPSTGSNGGCLATLVGVVILLVILSILLPSR